MTPAERQITLEHLAWLRDEARKANASYDAARKAYKRQQRSEAKKRSVTEDTNGNNHQPSCCNS